MWCLINQFFQIISGMARVCTALAVSGTPVTNNLSEYIPYSPLTVLFSDLLLLGMALYRLIECLPSNTLSCLLIRLPDSRQISYWVILFQLTRAPPFHNIFITSDWLSHTLTSLINPSLATFPSSPTSTPRPVGTFLLSILLYPHFTYGPLSILIEGNTYPAVPFLVSQLLEISQVKHTILKS